MATAIVKSLAITNRDASPQVYSNANLSKGALLEAVGTCEIASTQDLGSTYIMASVPSNARISQLLFSCDDVGTTGLADIGVYQTTANGSAVVDADFFASAVDMNAAALNAVDVTNEADPADAAAGYGKADIEKPLWQALGLSADSNRFYDIVLTTTEASTTAGTLTLKVRYVV